LRIRTEWRDMVTAASDLALVGIAVAVLAVPVVTAGAAVRTGSVAVRQFIDNGGMPPFADLWGVFRRSLLPGLGAVVAVLTVVALLVVNVVALRTGRVPGGGFGLLVTALAVAALVAVAALAVVRLGAEPAGTWGDALRWAGHTALGAPLAAAALVGVTALATAIAAMIPVTVPIVLGYLLFALHVVTRRLVPEPARLRGRSEATEERPGPGGSGAHASGASATITVPEPDEP
jgi:hypothetical protein